ncbi:hypothetical protein SMKI_14G0150 [Saccharomyces mikatae IFO 1815]|uniref:Alkylphosphocholine resistance protein LEM3 n=1 Tax=Saccharomyces mikatae IFO 1815 TaxID=226126 RepID=A0AA35ITD6_SACMI|nr:uncharacterized protein SMKI_14G0150 [Saccharomyces mikatae IFO 1815]CAI4035808.1 hypothetical protein SMKI_14G0150 [Saccharomyces mikatae IFO 1815]
MVNFDLGQVGEVFRRKDKGAIVAEDNSEEEDVDASEFEEDEVKPVRTKNRRPKEDAFTQQRLAAINPVLTPRTVLPLYLLIAVVFVIVGGCILAQNAKVDEVTIYYQDCMKNATSSWSEMPSEYWQLLFHKNKTYNVAPQWKFVDDESDDFTKQRGTCQIRFHTPTDMKNSVYLNYVLEKFAANHRRYVLSFSEDQIRGEDASYETVHDATGINCKPLSKNADGKIYYPCGLIANSMFNDSFPLQLVNVDDTSKNYSLTNKGINWESDKKRFKKTKYNYTQIAPPPYWENMYPDGYNETNIPDIQDWEEFQNWMRPGAFDKITKLIRINKNESLPAGEYQLDIGLHWPVLEFNGKKGIYLTHGSHLGGSNPFLGIVYLIGGCICAAMALILLSFWLIGGRKIADASSLSWNMK